MTTESLAAIGLPQLLDVARVAIGDNLKSLQALRAAVGDAKKLWIDDHQRAVEAQIQAFRDNADDQRESLSRTFDTIDRAIAERITDIQGAEPEVEKQKAA